MKRTTDKPNRLNRKDASADEERRRMVEKLCMFNSYQCVGVVAEYPHSGRSFGEAFTTTAMLCELHRERPPAPYRKSVTPPPENQSRMPL